MSDQQAPDVDVVLGAPLLHNVLAAIGTNADAPLDADLLALVFQSTRLREPRPRYSKSLSL